MASWKPHGLIQKQTLEASYKNAKLAVDDLGNSNDPKEHFTVKLWEDLFNKQLFQGDDFTVNSQQPPSKKKGSEKACDIVIMYVDNDYEHQILCFAECKRTTNVKISKIRALETQAQGYCEEFLEAHPDINIAYACTLVGAFIRCWSLHRGDDKLKGFWSGNEKDNFEHYKDAGSDDDKQIIEWAFDRMKSIPTAGLRLGQDHSTLGGQLGTTSGSERIYAYADQAGYLQPTMNPLTGSGNLTSNPTFYLRSQGIPGLTEVEQQKKPSNMPLLLDEHYVEVSVRKYGQSIGEHMYRFVHGAKTIEKKGNEWHSETTMYEGQLRSCMVCVGKNSGIRYWTWALDPTSPSVIVDVKNKGKGKKNA